MKTKQPQKPLVAIHNGTFKTGGRIDSKKSKAQKNKESCRKSFKGYCEESVNIEKDITL